MDALTYTEARARLKQTMDKVCDDHTPVTITRKTHGHVVMLSLEDYNAMSETMYLLRSPRNTARLVRALADVASGDEITERSLAGDAG